MSLTDLKFIDRVSLAERRSVPIISLLLQFRVELVKCAQRWVTSDSVTQRPNPQRPNSRLASVRVSRSASAPNVVDFFVDMSPRSVQYTNEACLPCLPLYPLPWRLAPTQVCQRCFCAHRLRSMVSILINCLPSLDVFLAISQLFRFIPSRL